MVEPLVMHRYTSECSLTLQATKVQRCWNWRFYDHWWLTFLLMVLYISLPITAHFNYLNYQLCYFQPSWSRKLSSVTYYVQCTVTSKKLPLIKLLFSFGFNYFVTDKHKPGAQRMVHYPHQFLGPHYILIMPNLYFKFDPSHEPQLFKFNYSRYSVTVTE